MADRIVDLPAADPLTGDETTLVIQGGATKQAPLSNIVISPAAISTLPVATTLDGTEPTLVVQGGLLKQAPSNSYLRRGAWCVNLDDYTFDPTYGWLHAFTTAMTAAKLDQKPLYIPSKATSRKFYTDSPGSSGRGYIHTLASDATQYIIKGDGPGCSVLECGDPAQNMGFFNINRSIPHVTIDGLELKGAYGTGDPALGHGFTNRHLIRMLSGPYMLLRDVWGDHASSYGIGMEVDENSGIIDGYFEALLHNCFIQYAQQDCFDLKNRTGGNNAIVVEGCRGYYPSGTGSDDGDACFDGRGRILVNNFEGRIDPARGGVGFRFREDGDGNALYGSHHSIATGVRIDLVGAGVGSTGIGCYIAGAHNQVKGLHVFNSAGSRWGIGVQTTSTSVWSQVEGLIENVSTGAIFGGPGSARLDIRDVSTRAVQISTSYLDLDLSLSKCTNGTSGSPPVADNTVQGTCIGVDIPNANRHHLKIHYRRAHPTIPDPARTSGNPAATIYDIDHLAQSWASSAAVTYDTTPSRTVTGNLTGLRGAVGVRRLVTTGNTNAKITLPPVDVSSLNTWGTAGQWQYYQKVDSGTGVVNIYLSDGTTLMKTLTGQGASCEFYTDETTGWWLK